MTLMMFLAMLEDPADLDKFELLYAEHESCVLRITYNILGNQHDAEEAAQDAFLTLAKNIRKLDLCEKARTKSYVCKTAESAAKMLYRKRKTLPEIESVDDYESIPSDMQFEQDDSAVLLQYIARLPSAERDTMILYYVSKMDIQAIADALYITVSAAKGRLTRGNKALKAMLQEVENEG